MSHQCNHSPTVPNPVAISRFDGMYLKRCCFSPPLSSNKVLNLLFSLSIIHDPLLRQKVVLTWLLKPDQTFKQLPCLGAINVPSNFLKRTLWLRDTGKRSSGLLQKRLVEWRTIVNEIAQPETLENEMFVLCVPAVHVRGRNASFDYQTCHSEGRKKTCVSLHNLFAFFQSTMFELSLQTLTLTYDIKTEPKQLAD